VTKRILRLTLGLALGLFAAPVLSQPEYSEEKAVACLDCHGTPEVLAIVDTVHANFDDPRTPAAQRQCQSCHGPSKVHMQFPMQVENVHFGKGSATDPKAQNQTCLACHENGESGWNASAHGFENVLCSACHNMHNPEKVVPARAKVSEGCGAAGCHEDLVLGSKASDLSHATGAVLGDKGGIVCSDCHDPHGPLSSGRCGDCHHQTAPVLALQKEKARRFHEVARERGTECMRCHRGISHPLPDDLLEAARRERDRHAR
jgi:hypothetical protein